MYILEFAREHNSIETFEILREFDRAGTDRFARLLKGNRYREIMDTEITLLSGESRSRGMR